MIDPGHWLWRLSTADWLAAANVELELGHEHIGSRRIAVTHARRAAGMALNGVLVVMAGRGWSRDRCEHAWRRSYIEHLRVLAELPDGEDSDLRGPLDAQVCARCRELLAIPVMPPTDLVQLARSRDQAAHTALELAAGIVRSCAALEHH